MWLVAIKEPQVEVRRVEHATHDLRWLKTTHSFRINRGSWMACKMPRGLLKAQRRDAGAGRTTDIEGSDGMKGIKGIPVPGSVFRTRRAGNTPVTQR